MINYYLLTKPGIILGNLIPFTAAFLLASKGVFHFSLFFLSLMGLAFVIASACVINNIFDLPFDKKMERTKNRPLPSGRISLNGAFLFGVALSLLGFGMLLMINPLTAFVAASGFLIYVFPYTLWKSRTVYATAIGSIAGAVPPLVGYTAVSNSIDTAGILFFLLMVLWQMPHFFSIAIMNMEDYQNAGIPVLPLIKGIRYTQIRSSLYIITFILICTLFTLWGYTGNTYLLVTLVTGFAWLFLSLIPLQEKKWARSMFQMSLINITVLCLAIALDINKEII